jgi:hypothetical protein
MSAEERAGLFLEIREIASRHMLASSFVHLREACSSLLMLCSGPASALLRPC